MATWRDGAAYAPLIRPDGFATPEVKPLDVVEPHQAGTPGPGPRPGGFQLSGPTRPLDQHAGTVESHRNPHQPFETSSTLIATASVHHQRDPRQPFISSAPGALPPPSGSPVRPNVSTDPWGASAVGTATMPPNPVMGFPPTSSPRLPGQPPTSSPHPPGQPPTSGPSPVPMNWPAPSAPPVRQPSAAQQLQDRSFQKFALLMLSLTALFSLFAPNVAIPLMAAAGFFISRITGRKNYGYTIIGIAVFMLMLIMLSEPSALALPTFIVSAGAAVVLLIRK